ncbi:DHA2 family efflux MFS transporter permease subunit [Amycolatopsis sp. WGS_07]|uniref:DHA2 family efflux MFS transporter permease subunit n=1 Tax=Amycolatopsis sp. WGS_07 TaxID=3076764 RepID=UPI00387382F2
MTSATSAKRVSPWAGLVAVVLGVVVVALDGTIVAAANPRLSAELGATLGDLQWITNIYLLVMAPSTVLAGRIGDRFGRRRVFLAGVAGFGLASAAAGLAGSVAMVVVTRSVQGFFGGLIMTNALALLRATFPPERLPAAVSVFGALAASSIAAGPVVGGVVVDQLGWRWAFFVNVPVAVFSLLAGLRALPRLSPGRPGRFDLGGAALLTAGLLALAYGLVRAPSAGWGDAVVLGSLIAAVPIGAAFVLVERKARNPIVPLRIFADRSISGGIVLSVATDFAMIALPVFVSLLLQKTDGRTPIEASLRLAPLGVAAVLGSTVSARLLPKAGRRPVIVAGALISAVGFALLTDVEQGSSYLAMAASFAVLGLGLSLVMNSAVQAVLGNAAEQDAGAAAGVQQAAGQIGGLLGISVLGAVLATTASARFRDLLLASGLPQQFAEQGAGTVAQGVAPAGAPAAVANAAHEAFLSGIHSVMWAGAGLSVLCCAVGFVVR